MMLLGKRPRPPIRRTSSMTGITVDLSNVEHSEEASSDHFQNPFRDHHHLHETGDDHNRQEENIIGRQNYNNNNIINIGGGGGANGFDDPFYSNNNNNNLFAAVVSPRNHRRNSVDHTIETAHFLKTCGLCKRRLVSGRDIYMYRGDTAFCSQECREQQMKQDERKEKNCSVPSSNDDRHAADF